MNIDNLFRPARDFNLKFQFLLAAYARHELLVQPKSNYEVMLSKMVSFKLPKQSWQHFALSFPNRPKAHTWKLRSVLDTLKSWTDCNHCLYDPKPGNVLTIIKVYHYL